MVTVKQIATSMKDINMLSSYEFTPTQILAYAEKLISLYPNLTVERMDQVMDGFFKGTNAFSHFDGIRNFTKVLSKRITMY